jgi:hypothetical protein
MNNAIWFSKLFAEITIVQIDFDYIYTILLTLMITHGTPENLDRYTIISTAISNANAQL